MINSNYPYVSYLVAVGLTSYGFDVPLFTYYDINSLSDQKIKVHAEKRFININKEKYSIVTAPTYWDVIDWFRIQHGIFIEVTPSYYGSEEELIKDKEISGYHYRVYNSVAERIETELEFLSTSDEELPTYQICNSFEEAQLEAINCASKYLSEPKLSYV